MLDEPGFVDRFVEKFNEQLGVARDQAQRDDGLGRQLEQQIAESQRRVSNLTKSMAELGLDDDIAARFREKKAHLQRLRSQRAARTAALDPAGAAPDPDFAKG